jgi:hypothetical protein
MVQTHTIDSWVSEKCSFDDLVEKAIPGIREHFMLKYGQDICEGVMLRLSIGEDDIYKPGSRSQSLLKFKQSEDAEFTIKFLNETKKGSGELKSVQCLLDTGKRRYFTVPATDWSQEQRRYHFSNRSKYAEAHHKDNEEPFYPEYKATVAFVGWNKNGTPKSPRLIGFRHKNDMSASEFESQRVLRVMGELETLKSEYCVAGRSQLVESAKMAARHILDRTLPSKDDEQEAGTNQMLQYWTGNGRAGVHPLGLGLTTGLTTELQHPCGPLLAAPTLPSFTLYIYPTWPHVSHVGDPGLRHLQLKPLFLERMLALTE